MTLRRVVPLVVLAGTILVLGVPLVLGDAGARLGASFAIGSIAVVAAVVVRGRAGEHGEDGAVVRLADGLAANAASMLGLAVVLTTLVLWSTAPGSRSRVEAGWFGPVLAVAAASALVVPIVLGARAVVRWEGIERDTLLKATSIAFFVTVLLAGAYALFEVLADAPTLSMFSVWTVGMLTWAIAATVLHRRVA